ncbi:hypothetical protein LY78DRAFT_481544 [Colletotrichum sublineola]|nr:hypothetical protein LY78DRAFT_481544 [Colletotrichum sublineola]
MPGGGMTRCRVKEGKQDGAKDRLRRDGPGLDKAGLDSETIPVWQTKWQGSSRKGCLARRIHTQAHEGLFDGKGTLGCLIASWGEMGVVVMVVMVVVVVVVVVVEWWHFEGVGREGMWQASYVTAREGRGIQGRTRIGHGHAVCQWSVLSPPHERGEMY